MVVKTYVFDCQQGINHHWIDFIQRNRSMLLSAKCAHHFTVGGKDGGWLLILDRFKIVTIRNGAEESGPG